MSGSRVSDGEYGEFFDSRCINLRRSVVDRASVLYTSLQYRPLGLEGLGEGLGVHYGVGM